MAPISSRHGHTQRDTIGQDVPATSRTRWAVPIRRGLSSSTSRGGTGRRSLSPRTAQTSPTPLGRLKFSPCAGKTGLPWRRRRKGGGDDRFQEEQAARHDRRRRADLPDHCHTDRGRGAQGRSRRARGRARSPRAVAGGVAGRVGREPRAGAVGRRRRVQGRNLVAFASPSSARARRLDPATNRARPPS